MLPHPSLSSYLTSKISLYKSGKPREWAGHSRTVSTVEWSNDGKYLASAGEDKYIKLWTPERLNSGARSSDLSFEVPPNSHITSFAWPRTRPTYMMSPPPTKSHEFATGALNGFLYLWDPRQPKPTSSTRMSHSILSVSFMPDATFLLVATTNNCIELVDPRYLGHAALQKTEFQVRLNVAQFDTSESLRLFAGLENGEIHCLDAMTFVPLTEPFLAHVSPCTAIAFDPMHRWIASGGLESLIVLYEWDTLMPSKVCKYDEDVAVRDLCFTFDGEFISAAADSSTLTTWASEYGLPAFLVNTNATMTLEHVRWHPRKAVVACTYKRDRAGKFFLFSHPEKSSS